MWLFLEIGGWIGLLERAATAVVVTVEMVVVELLGFIARSS